MEQRTPSLTAARPRADRLCALVVVAAAFALRVLPFTSRVFAGGGLLPSGDADVYYHLRRIELATRQWPHVPDFDAWMNFPSGGFTPWAPLFDFIPATLARASGLPYAWIAVLWPPLLGALSVLPLWALLRPLVGSGAAWLAALLFAALPVNVAISVLGRVDHHVAEVALQLWVYAWLVRDLRALEATNALRLRTSIGFGLLIGACLLTWAASLIFLWVVPAAACLWSLPPRSREHARAIARHLVTAFATATLCCAPFALLNVAHGRAAFAYYHLSLLTLLLCFALGAIVAAWAWVLAPLGGDGAARRSAMRASCVAAAACSLLLVPALRTGLLGGLGFIGRNNDFVAEISESAPLLSTPLARGFAAQHVGYGHMLLPALCVWLALRCLWRRERTAAQLVLACYAFNVTALAFLQARFLYYAGPLVAAAPFLVYAGLERRNALLRVAATALCLAAPWPALAYFWSPLLRANEHVPLAQIDGARLEFVLEVAAVTPPAGDAQDAAHPPSYCVFAPWDLGHQLLAIAGRAVVANNYGDQLEGGSFADEQHFYRSLRDDDEALRLLARRRCPYLVTIAPATRQATNTSAARLHIANGSDLPLAPGSGRFRLIAVAPQRDATELYKLFAVVPGALLRVTDAGAGPALQAVSDQMVGGQSFEYRRTLAHATAPAGTGAVEARLAYPGDYRLLGAGRELARFSVSQAAVAGGKTVQLTRAPGSAEF